MKQVEIIRGPKTANVKREDAEAQLRNHPRFPREAAFTLEEVEGRWVAAIALPKVAAPPFPPAEESAPAGESEGPPSEPEPSPEPEGDSEDKPKDDKPKEPKGEKGGEQHMITQIYDMLSKLTEALGLSSPDVPMGGEGEGPPTPPPGADAPPGAGGPGDGKMHTVHERSLKPGEVPPGVTTVGQPAFSSTIPEDHPWRDQLTKGAKFWDVEEEIGSEPISLIARELAGLATPVGCKVENLKPFTTGTRRMARARIARVR